MKAPAQRSDLITRRYARVKIERIPGNPARPSVHDAIKCSQPTRQAEEESGRSGHGENNHEQQCQKARAQCIASPQLLRDRAFGAATEDDVQISLESAALLDGGH